MAEAGLAEDAELLGAITETADPDLALGSLAAVFERAGQERGGEEAAELRVALREDGGLRDRLFGVLGASAALGDHLVRHPGDWRELLGPDALYAPDPGELRASLLNAVGADPLGGVPVARSDDALDALRRAYRRRVLRLAGRDLTGVTGVEEVAAELADLAAAALEAALAIARSELPAGAEPARLSIVAMGKAGGRELNYVSDVDVIFVAEPEEGGDEEAALRTANRLAAGTMRAASASTPEGSLWQVDAGLRPEGNAGPLVRTLASHLAYYQRWAKTWEFQALLKARPVAGDAELGEAYMRGIAPLVWRAAGRDHFIEDVQAMRRRVIEHIPGDQAERQLKLGPGGLRDVEFAVQLLQLVHGRTNEDPPPRILLRSANTLTALEALSRGGYVGREDAAELAEAYRFLRRVEHLLQLYRLRRTHLVPDDDADLRRIGRALGLRGDPVREFTALWRRHAREVRRIHEKLFYRPLLQAVARLPEAGARLTPDDARARLEALGYADPAGALRHIEALASGVSRRAAIQRTLLPVMLGWFADGPDPDAGLLGFRRVSEALGSTPWYLRLLRDHVEVAERMAHLLASSRYATDLLLRAPDAVGMLADDADLTPRPRAALRAEATALLRRHDDAEPAVDALRGLRRRELFRVSAADLLGMLDVDAVGTALTDITAVTIEAALSVAVRSVESVRGPLPTRFAVIGMGRFGGGELGYGSDADVVFVHDPLPAADGGPPADAMAAADEKAAGDAAHAVAEELRRLLSRPAPEPPLIIDAGLRPEGRQGPLVRTLASYAGYYRRWSSPWEAQALLRAAPVAGDAETGRGFAALIDPLRWPDGGIDEGALLQIRRLKARMEAERLPRGADPGMHTKLGPGGLSDVEWVAQLLQLRHACTVPALRTTRTLAALSAATDAGLLDAADAEVLTEAWRLATRIRGAIVLVRGKAADSIPTDLKEAFAVARVLGLDSRAELLEDYRRVTRRARAVMERVFYG